MKPALFLTLASFAAGLLQQPDPPTSESEAVATIERLKGTVVCANNRPGQPVIGVNL